MCSKSESVDVPVTKLEVRHLLRQRRKRSSVSASRKVATEVEDFALGIQWVVRLNWSTEVVRSSSCDEAEIYRCRHKSNLSCFSWRHCSILEAPNNLTNALQLLWHVYYTQLEQVSPGMAVTKMYQINIHAFSRRSLETGSFSSLPVSRPTKGSSKTVPVA